MFSESEYDYKKIDDERRRVINDIDWSNKLRKEYEERDKEGSGIFGFVLFSTLIGFVIILGFKAYHTLAFWLSSVF